MKKILGILLVTATFLLTSFAANANKKNDTIYFNCKYPIYASKKGVQKVSPSNPFYLLFTVKNFKKAYLKGNLSKDGDGDEVLIATFNRDQIVFIEKTISGNVQLTAINLTNGESIHSRHTFMLGEFVESQYYGICTLD